MILQGLFSCAPRQSAALLILLATSIALPAQNFNTLVMFDSANGSNPAYGPLIQATDGNFYGTTAYGGNLSNQCPSGGCGTIFKITPGGVLTTIYSFCSQPYCADGAITYGGLIQAGDGNLYGTTAEGGAGQYDTGCGTIFKITLSGQFTTLYSFCNVPNFGDGVNPVAGLVQAGDGNFYGTTGEGGTNGNFGTIFRITPTGVLTTLHSFCAEASCTDGIFPYAPLIQASNGELYGTTSDNIGYVDYGTVFKITTAGTFTSLHSFSFSDGAYVAAGVVQAANGNMYGVTGGGGVYSYGTIFTISASGSFSTLYNFCDPTNCTEASSPIGTLVQAPDGNFYGTTGYGGDSTNCVDGCGAVYKVTPSGTLTTLHSFDGTDGDQPEAGLLQSTSGIFYGVTLDGGTSEACGRSRCGTLFRLSNGLGPFVETNRTSGKAGTSVAILGNNLTGATSVTFNGVAASFTVISASEIKTMVPEGATSGFIQVTTPSGMLKGNKKFRVTQ